MASAKGPTKKQVGLIKNAVDRIFADGFNVAEVSYPTTLRANGIKQWYFDLLSQPGTRVSQKNSSSGPLVIELTNEDVFGILALQGDVNLKGDRNTAAAGHRGKERVSLSVQRFEKAARKDSDDVVVELRPKSSSVQRASVTTAHIFDGLLMRVEASVGEREVKLSKVSFEPLQTVRHKDTEHYFLTATDLLESRDEP